MRADIACNVLYPFRRLEPHVGAVLMDGICTESYGEVHLGFVSLTSPPSAFLPLLPNAEHGRGWLGLHHSQRCLTKIQRQWAQTELQSNTAKPLFCHEYRQTLEHSVQRGCWSSILGDTWNPAGSTQSVLALFWTGQLDQTMSRGHLPPPLCTDSMN